MKDVSAERIVRGCNKIKLRKILLISAVLFIFGLALLGNHLFSLQAAGQVADVPEDQASIADLNQTLASEPALQEAAQPEEPVPQLTTHVVAAGETLSSIASKYGTDTASLVSVNHLQSSTIRVGQTLRVLTVKGLVHKVASGDTLWDIASAYKVALSAILAANPGLNAAALPLGKELILPGATKPVVRTAVASRGSSRSTTSRSATNSSKTSSGSSRSSSSSMFSWPTSRHKINSSFGYRSGGFHEALDIGVSTGTPVKAAASGTVTYAGWATGYGYLVKISHGNGYETRYGHNSKLLVSVGQAVAKGQTISLSGSTGNSTGPHLHFEIRKYGTPVNPLGLLR
jgi:murein DD-endopeptidase MepM/ murein hydrolase activator NlpD